MKHKEAGLKFLLILVLVITFASLAIGVCLLFYEHEEPVTISDNVKVDMYGRHEYGIDLESDWDFDDLKVGDRFTVSRKLEQYDLKIPYLYFYIDNVQYEISLDDEVIYESGKDAAKENRAVGGGLHIVPVPPDYAGKTLKLKFVVIENFKDGVSGYIGMKSMESFVVDLINDNLSATIVALFSIFCAIVSLLIFVCFGRIDRTFRRPIWMSFLIMSVGLYMLSREGILYFLFPQSIRELCIESFTSLLILIFGNLCFFDLFDFKRFKTEACIAATSTVATVAYALIVTILHLTSAVHIYGFKKFDMFVGGVGVLLYAVLTIKNIKKINLVDILLSVSVLIVCVGLFVDNMILLGISINIDINRATVLAFANVTFILIASLAYAMVVRELFEKSLEQKLLTGKAYMDSLTGLHNRAYCEHFLEEAAADGEYTLINFDLNGLKYVNDNYGHKEGDDYLMAFAKKLKSEYEGIGCAGRMGGDEFIAILDTADTQKVKESIEKLRKSLTKDAKSFTENYKKGGVSFAYGYCISTKEKPYNPTKAFEIADMKMYSNKQNMKGDNSDAFFRP